MSSRVEDTREVISAERVGAAAKASYFPESSLVSDSGGGEAKRR